MGCAPLPRSCRHLRDLQLRSGGGLGVAVRAVADEHPVSVDAGDYAVFRPALAWIGERDRSADVPGRLFERHAFTCPGAACGRRTVTRMCSPSITSALRDP